MKTTNLVKILIVIIMALSIGLIGTSIKLISKGKWISNQDTPTTANKNSKEIVREPNDKIVSSIPEIQIKEETKEHDVEIEKEEEKETTKKDSSNKNNDKKEEDKPEKKDKKIKEEKKDKKEKEDKKEKKEKEDKKDKKDKRDKKSIVKPTYITKDEAIEIGIKKVGVGAKVIKVKSDLEDNPPKFELEIQLKNHEYELEIHAITGSIIDFEKEKIDD